MGAGHSMTTKAPQGAHDGIQAEQGESGSTSSTCADRHARECRPRRRETAGPRVGPSTGAALAAGAEHWRGPRSGNSRGLLSTAGPLARAKDRQPGNLMSVIVFL